MADRLFVEYLAQLSQWQKQAVDIWLRSFSLKESPQTHSDVQTIVSYQEKLVKSGLEAQAIAMELAITSQILFWDGYFEFVRETLDGSPGIQR